MGGTVGFFVLFAKQDGLYDCLFGLELDDEGRVGTLTGDELPALQLRGSSVFALDDFADRAA